MNNLNKDGARAVPAAMAPWAMKYRVGHPYTRWQDNSNGKKTIEESLPSRAHIIPSIDNYSVCKSAASIKGMPTHQREGGGIVCLKSRCEVGEVGNAKG